MTPSSFSSSMEEGPEIVALSVKIMIATIIFVFIMVVIIVSLYFYNKSNLSRYEGSTIVSWRRRTATTQRRGLEPSALGLVPVVEYNPKDNKEDLLECAVCLSEVLEGDRIKILPKCKHRFHVECIDMWFYSHVTCPLCRSSVVCDDQDLCCTLSNDNNIEGEMLPSDVANSPTQLDGCQMHVGQSETPTQPTNVLLNGNEAQVNSLEPQPEKSIDKSDSFSLASSSSNFGNDHGRPRNGGLVIEIPTQLCGDCLQSLSPSPFSGARFDDEEPRSPAMATLRSLKRLLSRGKRVMVPSPRASSSTTDFEP